MKRVVARSRAPTPQIQDKLYLSKLAELSQTISGCKKIHTIAKFHSHLQPLHFFFRSRIFSRALVPNRIGSSFFSLDESIRLARGSFAHL
jgi:hypothetical protein